MEHQLKKCTRSGGLAFYHALYAIRIGVLISSSSLKGAGGDIEGGNPVRDGGRNKQGARGSDSDGHKVFELRRLVALFAHQTPFCL